jgi:purine-binding chemotaxis protein CheW
VGYESESTQFVVFRLDKEEYAFDISHVREIHALQEIAKVHRAPEYIEGVMNLRGKLITVIDLRKRFRLDAKAADESSRIVVVDSSDAPVGFLVDEVREVIRLPEYVAQGIESEYVLGIAKQDSRLITLIDPAKVLELSCDSQNPDGGGA